MRTNDRHGDSHAADVSRRGDSSGDPLRDLLRRGDPAGDGREPTGIEWAAMRARIRTEVSSVENTSSGRSRAPLATWAWIAAAASIAVAVVLLPRLLQAPDGTQDLVAGGTDGSGTTATGAAAQSGRASEGSRTMQFTAPGGTRVVWTLDPGFELPESLNAMESD